MPATSELTVDGVRLLKHAGDGYHEYRGTLEGAAITIRPTLSRYRRVMGWRCYAELDGETEIVGTADTIFLTIKRARYSLSMRRASQ